MHDLRRLNLNSRLMPFALALVLLMRVLVPEGFMPVAQAQGISIVMCNGHGVVQADASRQHAPHQNAPQCAYDAMHAAIGFVSGDAATLATPEPHYFIHRTAKLADLTAPRLAAPPPPAQAPPVLI